MEKELTKLVYSFWSRYDDKKDRQLLKEIKTNIKTTKGVDILLDWCRDEFDKGDKMGDELDYVWDILNWYKGYLENKYTKEWINGLIDDYYYFVEGGKK